MRTEKVRRFADVQRQLQRAVEWTLHEMRREEHRLQMAQQDVLTALNREDALSIGLAPALTRKLARLATDADAAAVAGARQVDVVLQQASRLKHAERLEHKVRAEEEKSREKIVLGDLLDVIVGGRGAIVR